MLEFQLVILGAVMVREVRSFPVALKTPPPPSQRSETVVWAHRSFRLRHFVWMIFASQFQILFTTSSPLNGSALTTIEGTLMYMYLASPSQSLITTKMLMMLSELHALIHARILLNFYSNYHLCFLSERLEGVAFLFCFNSTTINLLLPSN